MGVPSAPRFLGHGQAILPPRCASEPSWRKKTLRACARKSVSQALCLLEASWNVCRGFPYKSFEPRLTVPGQRTTRGRARPDHSTLASLHGMRHWTAQLYLPSRNSPLVSLAVKRRRAAREGLGRLRLSGDGARRSQILVVSASQSTPAPRRELRVFTILSIAASSLVEEGSVAGVVSGVEKAGDGRAACRADDRLDFSGNGSGQSAKITNSLARGRSSLSRQRSRSPVDASYTRSRPPSSSAKLESEMVNAYLPRPRSS